MIDRIRLIQMTKSFDQHAGPVSSRPCPRASLGRRGESCAGKILRSVPDSRDHQYSSRTMRAKPAPRKRVSQASTATLART
jgi:hypothetical protein